MKKYLLFTGDKYYASGGWLDFTMASDDLDEIMGSDWGEYDWWHIVNTETMEIVDNDGYAHS